MCPSSRFGSSHSIVGFKTCQWVCTQSEMYSRVHITLLFLPQAIKHCFVFVLQLGTFAVSVHCFWQCVYVCGRRLPQWHWSWPVVNRRCGRASRGPAVPSENVAITEPSAPSVVPAGIPLPHAQVHTCSQTCTHSHMEAYIKRHIAIVSDLLWLSKTNLLITLSHFCPTA